MNEWHKFHLFRADNSFDYVIVIVILEVSQMLISSDKCVVTQLGLKIYTKCLNTISHTVRSLHPWQVLQELRVHSHIRWLLMQLIIIRWAFILLLVANSGIGLVDSVAAHVGGAVLKIVGCLSGLTTTGFDHSCILILVGDLAFNILVVLVLWVFATTCSTSCSILSILKVIWESSAVWVLLWLVLIKAFVTWYTRKLLLALSGRGATLHAWLEVWLNGRRDALLLKAWLLDLLGRSCTWSTSTKSYFLFVVLTLLYSHFWLTCLNLIALLWHAFNVDIAALFFTKLFFFFLLLLTTSHI